MDDLLQEFVAETRETLEALAGEIVVWETDPTDRARLDAIFRFVHTVKGSCGFLDLPRLARLSHAAEDVLAAVRDGQRTADTALVNGVLAIVDRIGEIVEAIDAGVALDDTGEDLLIAALDTDAVSVAEPAEPAIAVPVQPRGQTRSVRLSVDLLDRMMSGMSELVLARNELARRMRDRDTDPASCAALERLSLTLAELRDTVTRTRMQPIDALFSALPRIVRDTAGGLGKKVTLSLAGSDVELDREMIELMRDPLVHILRNAIDHGIETVEQRIAAGKPSTGRIGVAARQSGNTILIEVADDGCGIDTGRLIAKLSPGDPRGQRVLSERERLELIFEPGLSSRDEVTAISGRGVGMDVVRANIEQIGGRVELDNRPGRGLTIVIHVPLTLSILPTIVFGAGGQRFAMARQSIEEIVSAGSDTIRVDAVGDGKLATVRGRRMPLVDLPELLGVGKSGERATLAIVSVAGGSMALAVDTVFDSEELVIRPAAPAVMASGLYAGQTLPDTGVPMLVLDANGIASACGIVFERDERADLVEADVGEAAAQEVLLFVDGDGVRRALPLAAVDRVEQVVAADVAFVGGRLRVTIDGRIVALVAREKITGTTSVVRLRDGAAELAYAVRETCGIVAIRGAIEPAAVESGNIGVAIIDDTPVELIDLHWLFGEIADGGGSFARGLCVIAGGEWMETFLAPVLERAGYRVATDAGTETPVAVLAMAGDDVAVGSAPVVRLSDARGGEGIYRYDRGAVLAAIAGSAG